MGGSHEKQRCGNCDNSVFYLFVALNQFFLDSSTSRYKTEMQILPNRKALNEDAEFTLVSCFLCRCVICMLDFVYGDPIRFLPCMHIYHMDCIDDWLMRSFTCPSCMEPVDAALLSSYETN